MTEAKNPGLEYEGVRWSSTTTNGGKVERFHIDTYTGLANIIRKTTSLIWNWRVVTLGTPVCYYRVVDGTANSLEEAVATCHERLKRNEHSVGH